MSETPDLRGVSLAGLLAPLPKEDQAAEWEEVSRRVRRLLGERAWLRRRPFGRIDLGGYEIGVANPAGRFELRAAGADWPQALADLHQRLTMPGPLEPHPMR